MTFIDELKGFNNQGLGINAKELLKDAILFGINKHDPLTALFISQISEKDITEFTEKEQNMIIKKMKAIYTVEVIASFIIETKFKEL